MMAVHIFCLRCNQNNEEQNFRILNNLSKLANSKTFLHDDFDTWFIEFSHTEVVIVWDLFICLFATLRTQKTKNKKNHEQIFQDKDQDQKEYFKGAYELACECHWWANHTKKLHFWWIRNHEIWYIIFISS